VRARRYLISGIVQGVGYRFFAVRSAQARAVGGWVRNLPDGRVEVLAQGDEAAIAALLEDLRRGPRSAAVSRVDEFEERPVEGLSGFDVRF